MHAIDWILENYRDKAIALTGCRAGNGYPYCEYDFIIDTDERILCIDDQYIRIHTLQKDPFRVALMLYDARIINDPLFMLASLRRDLEKYIVKALEWQARDAIFDAMLYAEKAKRANDRRIGSFFLKCSAYRYLTGIIAMNGKKPSPSHMLTQLRDVKRFSDGISIATEALMLERANSSSLSRAIEAYSGLKGKDIIDEMISRKISMLYTSGLYADCYLYINGICIKLASNEEMLKNNIFLFNLAMDLSREESSIERLAKLMFEACNALLKDNYY